jgi:hypothetical protein
MYYAHGSRKQIFCDLIHFKHFNADISEYTECLQWNADFEDVYK